MLERRNSDRIPLHEIWVKEENGDYLFSLKAKNLSEEGVYLNQKIRTRDQEPFSKLSFLLPNGESINNVHARMVRVDEKASNGGAAYEFLSLSEADRMSLKNFVLSRMIVGNA